MGSTLSRTPAPVFDEADRLLIADVSVPCTPGRTCVFGDGAPPVDVEWYVALPLKYSRFVSATVPYRVPGVGYGVGVGRFGDRLALRMTWPRHHEYASVPAASAQKIGRAYLVHGVAVPPGEGSGLRGLEAASALPVDTGVTFVDTGWEDGGDAVFEAGATAALGTLPGGQQRVINYSYMKSARR